VVGAIPADVPANATAAELVDRFEDPNVPTLRLAKQLDIAGRLVKLGDRSVLPRLERWLTDEDRHLRGNAAFVFAGLGDERGLQVIGDMLTDFSDRTEGEGIAMASSDGRYHVSQQIAADRYYAVHLLGALKNPRAISLLVPLLDDQRLNYKVVWALGEIGGPTVIEPLIGALDNESPDVRVNAIHALQTLGARQALPRLQALVADSARSHFGSLISVGEAARVAIDALNGAARPSAESPGAR
jgi:HEAT repeat protein